MISLFNYLQECGDCATPLDTMGMGNPVPADIGVEGTEPLVQGKPLKKKKRKLKESIFDDDDTILDNAEETYIRNCIKTLVYYGRDTVLGTPIEYHYLLDKDGDNYIFRFEGRMSFVTLTLPNDNYIKEHLPENLILDFTDVKGVTINVGEQRHNDSIIIPSNILVGKNTKIFIDTKCIDHIVIDNDFSCKEVHVEDNSYEGVGVQKITFNNTFKCNWVRLNGCIGLKEIICKGGEPKFIKNERYMVYKEGLVDIVKK